MVRTIGRGRGGVVCLIPMSARTQALLQQALAHHNAGRLREAESLYAQVRAADPKQFDAFHLSGFLALQQQRVADGVSLLQRACSLNSRHAQAALRLAHGLKLLGRLDEASVAATQAVTLDPKSADAHFSLGEIVSRREGFAAAVPHFRRVTELQPEAADGWANLGLALTQTQKVNEALTCFERALAKDANNMAALTGRALALQESHRISEAVAGYADVLARNPQHHEARSARLLALQYLGDLNRETLFKEHRAFGAAMAKVPTHSSFANRPDQGRRLRVGWVSPDFRNHSVAHFIEPLLTQLDREQFEIFLYHDHATVDAMSERLWAHADQWRHIAGQPADRVEALIRADAPDILIDLAGHTGFNRLPLFARRLAPLQATYLGYPDTTGLETMDLRFTDGIADPVGDADAFATEQLVRFSSCAWVYRPPVDAPEIGAPPSLVNRHVTFGCFNNFSKVSDETIRGWAGALKSVPMSRLLLKNHGLDDPIVAGRLAIRFASLGIDPLRLELLGRTTGTTSHLKLYARVDVALDTFPYHGTTTTCEALWQGRPVVTLAGQRHASRVGASLLSAVGHPEWIARDWTEYATIAAGLAREVNRRIELAGTLRGAVRNSVLMDDAGQARRLGSALRRSWSQWCERVPTALCA